VKNLISRTFTFIGSLLAGLHVKQVLSAVLVGFLLLTTNANPQAGNPATTKALNDVVHQDKSDRPKTVGEWKKEARQTEDATGKRTQRIAKESAEAVKDWGSVYPSTAERSGDAAKNDTRQAGKDLFGR
jgi:hypothetical protein